MRRRLHSEIMFLLGIKAVALVAIWYLFFSPAHRIQVDSEVTGERLGLTAPANAGAKAAVSRPTEKSHD